MLQLGKFLYSVTESLIFKRADRKYYEFLLHHFVATTLILFSMLTNCVAIGAVILVIHDVSDLPSAFIRGFIDTKYDNLPTGLIFFALWLGSWSYLRAVVFPFCIIKQIIEFYPNPSQLWWDVRLQIGYMGLLCSVLVCMHIFWIILLTKYAMEIIFSQKSKKS
jgi:ceramide synthetase